MDPQQRNVLSFIQQQMQQQPHPSIPFGLPNELSQAVLSQMMGDRSNALERNSLGK